VNGGVYWLEPEKHNIVFREPQEELYTKCKRAIPAHLWYSTDPYIDEFVRKDRFERIVMALHDSGFTIGPWAAKLIEDVKKSRDQMRVGARAAAAAAAMEEAPQSTTGETAGSGKPPLASKLSDGLGEMAEPAPGDEGVEFNPDARSAAYVFRAGSVLQDDRIGLVDKHVVMLRHDGELFAFQPGVLSDAFGPDIVELGPSGTTHMGAGLRVVTAVGKGARPELARVIGSYNIVQFDGSFYALPQSLGRIEWGVADLSATAGVFVSHTMKPVVRQVERALGIERKDGRQKAVAARPKTRSVIPLTMTLASEPAAPRLVGSVELYNVVEYEGWFYGLPQSLGTLDLTSTDVIEVPGVIRDLSREVVELEIRELYSKVATAG